MKIIKKRKLFNKRVLKYYLFIKILNLVKLLKVLLKKSKLRVVFLKFCLVLKYIFLKKLLIFKKINRLKNFSFYFIFKQK